MNGARPLRRMVLLIILVGLCASHSARAAEFIANFSDDLPVELGSHAIKGEIQGTIGIKGEIKRDDHLKLLNALGDREGEKGYLIYLDLNSPGGSFEEAIQIADIMKKRYLSTRIKANSQCLSACAIIFMAGNRITTGGSALTRELHSRGTLGFHAPTITITGGTFDSADVQAAYADAIESVGGKLLAVARYRDLGWDSPMIKSDLVNEMMRKQAQNFYYIDTVRRAVENDIDVVGADGPADLYQHVKDACGNATAKFYSSSVADEAAQDSEETRKSVVQHGTIYNTVLGLGECKITLSDDDGQVYPTFGGDIEINIRKWGGKRSAELWKWMYWPADTKLAIIPLMKQSK
jgi:hypothetical protein